MSDLKSARRIRNWWRKASEALESRTVVELEADESSERPDVNGAELADSRRQGFHVPIAMCGRHRG